jgi:protein-S-isoprenylcysteine O-methyltransferase Ste14
MILAIIGLIIRLFCVRQIGQNYWSIRPNKLVMDGMYKYVRHPMYVGSMCFFTGIFTDVCGLRVGLCLSFLAFYWILDRIDREESLLLYQHGENYFNYMKRTKMFIPFVI